MKTPSIGQMILARRLLTTGITARRRKVTTPPVYFQLGETAVVLTFVFFMFM